MVARPAELPSGSVGKRGHVRYAVAIELRADAPMNFSSRFWLFAPLAMFFAIAGWAMVHWWVVADAFDKKLTALNGHEALPGISVSYAGKTISGFPFNIDVVFTGFTVEGQGAHGPFRWTTENFALHRLTYGRTQDIYEAAGNQTLIWTDGRGKNHQLTFLPGSLRASAIIDGRGLLRFDLDMVAAAGSDSDGARFTTARSQLHLRRDPKGDALDLMVSGDDVKAGGSIAGLFGDHIKSLKLYATLTQGQAFAPLLAGQGSWAAASADWRGKGGQVAIGPVAIASSGLNLTANTFSDSGNDLRGVLDPLY
jgi:hypothetical protein